MTLTFTKMHLLGNDFMLIENFNRPFQPVAHRIADWADRRRGVGFDQLLLIEPTTDPQADFSYRIFNADGQEVAQCGNGSLCVADYLFQNKLNTSPQHIRLITQKGRLVITRDNDQRLHAYLGEPVFEKKDIPIYHEQSGPFYSTTTPWGDIHFCALSVGNPHCVIEVDDLAQAPVTELGTYLNEKTHPLFPEGTNVEFVCIESPQKISARVFERGAGETHACGSGACAAVIAGCLQKKLTGEVEVQLPGGILQVRWPGLNESVVLSGQGCVVFQGTLISNADHSA
jgi:diaminopimelate epimerase